ncbi:MAG: DNA/RNA non-specific endonuclease, partial [Gemmatimonadaceae bacterium]|nr:DNA/RNA non-specific endonuclease [Gloeobacterales cyanobacterium ES-bin-141]
MLKSWTAMFAAGSVISLLVVVSSTSALRGQPQPGLAVASAGSIHLALGNPSGATEDPANKDNFLVSKPQYALSYNDANGIANWVSWRLNKNDLGIQGRCKDSRGRDFFAADDSLPTGFKQIKPDEYDFPVNGFDRGHMAPSADRTANRPDNCATFLMTNMVPQRPNLNRQVWESLESDSRQLVTRNGRELYIIAGPGTKRGTIADNRVMVPASTWKVVVVLDAPELGLAGVNRNTRVIAVNMPNTKTISGNWRSYLVNVDQIEALTGLDLL